jgi:hypothetical protein
LLHAAIFGAYAERYIGLSPENYKRIERVVYNSPGQVGKLGRKLQEAVNSKNQAGNGAASKYYGWCGHEVDKY